MTKIANEKTLMGNASTLSVIRASATRQQVTEDFGSALDAGLRSGQMMSQINYGTAPLSDEEVRRLPVAHQYSS